jgi:hypothetical protein
LAGVLLLALLATAIPAEQGRAEPIRLDALKIPAVIAAPKEPVIFALEATDDARNDALGFCGPNGGATWRVVNVNNKAIQ